ncbi:hypothetical protein PHMEG_00021656 [Phytophthora megakarya]|uniref:PiggyBac transposable element-derived protein domain-containing protein n=1 Tax=Phytophthora megakarya TaxID=4795 RepID=A0A225VL26_9STRA|nr:hypothetical protein PHMEG_00021656 [Phytophthora megakarya]
MAAMKPIMLQELCRFVGLLVAGTIAPNREKLADHWKTADVGVIQTRPRELIQITPGRYASCGGITSCVAKPVVIQYDAGVYEGQSPQVGHEAFHAMQCSHGKQHTSDAHKTYMKSGSAAVVRNLLEVFVPEARKEGMRLIVIDRFYTIVALAIQLLLIGLYCVDTIITNRLGYCKDVIEK